MASSRGIGEHLAIEQFPETDRISPT